MKSNIIIINNHWYSKLTHLSLTICNKFWLSINIIKINKWIIAASQISRIQITIKTRRWMLFISLVCSIARLHMVDRVHLIQSHQVKLMTIVISQNLIGLIGINMVTIIKEVILDMKELWTWILDLCLQWQLKIIEELIMQIIKWM